MSFFIGVIVGLVLGFAAGCWALYEDKLDARQGVSKVEALGDAARKQ